MAYSNEWRCLKESLGMKTSILKAILAVASVALVPQHDAIGKQLSCIELVNGLEGKGDRMTDHGAILLGAAQTEKPKSCIPAGTMLATIRAVFIHWVDLHPEAVDMEAWGCAARAFAESYPCQGKK